MKRKNLKVGLRVEVKVGLHGTDHRAGAVGIVHKVEPDDYAGDLPCSVLFDSCATPLWLEESQIRIANKVRKAKPSEPAPSTKMTWPWPEGTLVRLTESAYFKGYDEVCVLGSDGSNQPPVRTRRGAHLFFVTEGDVTLAEDPEVAA